MSTLKADSFDSYADGNLASVSGGVWATASSFGNLNVASHAVQPNLSATDGSARLAAWTGSTTMQWAQCKFTVFADFIGPCVFHDGAGTFYSFDCRSDQCWLYKCVGGTFTSLVVDASVGAGFASGDVARLEAESNGTSVLLRGYKNGVLRVSFLDTAIPAGGRPGLRMWHANTAARIDDFAAGDLQVLTFTASNAAWAWSAIVATAVRAYGIGGGGGGGAATGSPCAGGGGKGGSYASVVITKGAESTLAVTVGAGGTAPAAADGGSGGASTVAQGASTVLSAPGGSGGGLAVTNSSNGTAGTAINGTSTGSTTAVGGNGGVGAFASGSKSGGGGGAASTAGNGGAGGAGVAGTANGTNAGAGGIGVGNNLTGTVGANYGGAGAGGKANTATDQLGGVGAPGIVWFVYDDPPAAPTASPSAAGYVILPR